MHFTKKTSCKGCQVERESICTVKKDENLLMCDKPTEPCFKPLTKKDCSIFFESIYEIQNAELEIYRANSNKEEI